MFNKNKGEKKKTKKTLLLKVPGVIDLASRHKVYIGGDDFKSGQTKIKSVVVDFLVNAGIKPIAITSYNHLGNNDGKNLNEHKQFRSKEISKSNVVDDMVMANPILYKVKTKNWGWGVRWGSFLGSLLFFFF